ncbi:translocation/assembly module TamB domain-containing protein [Methylotuvimicrobium buryatense]|uniref:Translocation/assembly module TamB n=1 Tax=Methylotuvimicrobium buryatense TaxID=95641 RepID=A0A4P9UQM7_METBY|nr:translocation/assembly module TamB domain-containing protein [Methylotuvimicrobium buryatense]QCW83749.1 translocation/assembly module TamB [Methylotuvimicrobium buryatense]
MNAKAIFKALVLTLSGTLLSLPIALLAILGSEPGSRWLIQTVISAAELDAEVERIDGTLLSELTLNKLVYLSETERVTLDTFIFAWRPSALLSGTLHIDRLAANGLSVEITDEAPESDDDEPFSMPNIPLAILIDDIDLQATRFRSGEQDIAIDRFRLRAALIDNTLRLTGLALEMPEATVYGRAEIELQPHFPLSAQLAWQLKLPETPAIDGEMTVLGTLKELMLTGHAEGPFQFYHEARLNLAESVPVFSVSGRWQRLQWPLDGEADIVSPEGEFTIDGNSDDYRIDLAAQLSAEQESFALQLAGYADSDSLTLERLELAPKQGRLTLAGRVIWADEPISVNLTGDWKKLQWPLSGPPQVETDQGRFDLSGTLDDYRIDLTAKLAMEQLPPFDVLFNGQGSTEAIDIHQLSLRPKQGRLDLKGKVSWRDAIDFALDLNAQQLDPGDFTPDISGSLNLQAAASGRFAEEQLTATLTIEKLHGTLFDSPIQGHGKLAFAEQRLTIDQLLLQSSENRLTADGILAETRSNLDFSIDAPNLAAVWPGLSGSIKGSGTVRGNYLDPAVKAQLNANKLSYQDFSIGLLTLNLDYAEALGQRSQLDLVLQGVELDGQAIDELTLQGSGSLNDHRFDAKLSSEIVKLDTVLNGSLRNQRWLATLERLDIDQAQIKQWRLDRPWPIRLDFAGDDIGVNLPQNCFVQTGAAICLSADGSIERRLNATAELRNIDLAMVKPWLPENLSLDGALNANANFLKRGERLTADADATVVNASLQLSRDGEKPLIFALSETRLKAQYGDERLDAELRIGLTGRDFISAQVKTAPLAATNAQSLTGNLQASIADLSLIDQLVQDIENLKGRITADLTLAGDTERPALSGLLQLSNAELDVPEIGIHPHNINLRLSGQPGQPEQLTLSGRIDSGKGSLYLDGTFDLNPEAGFPAELTITGSEFEIARLPEAEISVSPRLTVKQSEASVQVTGDVTVDSAELKLVELPETAIAPSADEIIIGREIVEEVETALNVQTDIGILLSEQVRFSGYGMDTRLTGNLRYTSSPGTQRMQGRVAMQDARYKAYGQDLTITRGEFLFNGPVDNPWLNIEATRKAIGEDVTAILTVTGPVKSPQTKVSSRPPMPESDALAYLLTGRSLQRTGESQANMLAKAAINYGAGELSWLSNQLGFDQFEVEEAQRLEDTAVRLGKYINPDLYLGFSLGLFSNTYAVILEQKLSQHFSLQTRAGESQRLDLKYRLEKD